MARQYWPEEAAQQTVAETNPALTADVRVYDSGFGQGSILESAAANPNEVEVPVQLGDTTVHVPGRIVLRVALDFIPDPEFPQTDSLSDGISAYNLMLQRTAGDIERDLRQRFVTALQNRPQNRARHVEIVRDEAGDIMGVTTQEQRSIRDVLADAGTNNAMQELRRRAAQMERERENNQAAVRAMASPQFLDEHFTLGSPNETAAQEEETRAARIDALARATLSPQQISAFERIASPASVEGFRPGISTTDIAEQIERDHNIDEEISPD